MQSLEVFLECRQTLGFKEINRVYFEQGHDAGELGARGLRDIKVTDETGKPLFEPTPSAKRRARSGPSTASNLTSIDGDVRSSYSTSASASAERQSMHQCTGL